MSFKPLFARSLGAAPDRLHMAAHSHHLWPDASFEGQVQAWEDAALLADRKWDKVMGEVWPEAQAHVAAELGTGMPDAVVFASNTHDLLVRIFAAAPRRSGGALRVLTSDGEFHSARRQLARWEEAGEVAVDRVAAEPFDSFTDRFVAAARAGGHDLILVSHVLFGSGRRFGGLDELAVLSRPEGPWVVVDGYHAFMALPLPLAPPLPLAGGAGGGPVRADATGEIPTPASLRASSPPASGRGALGESLFYLGGGYKYAMAGEGCAFMHAPPGFGARPPITGWYAEFEDLSLPPGRVGYAPDGRRFMGATFDPSGLYRFNAVRRMLAENGLTTERISAHVTRLQEQLVGSLAGTAFGGAERLNSPGDARFLAFRSSQAQSWCAELARRGCVTDVRGDVLRIGLGLYHDEEDVEAFARLAKDLR